MIAKLLRTLLASAALAAVVLCPALARAAPGDATRLEYARSERAARCPDRDALKSAVSKRLGYDPFFPAARQTIVVEITDVDEGLRAQMHLIDERGIIVGSRELKDEIGQCDELVASLALAISIALDPSAALSAEAEDNSEPASAEPKVGHDDQASAAPPEARDEPRAPPPPPKKSTRPRSAAPASDEDQRAIPITVQAGVFSTLGVAPALAAGFRIAVGARWSFFQLLGEFADQLPATHDAGPGGSVRAALNQGTLAPCVVHDAWAGCGLIQIGSLQSEGIGVSNPATKSLLYAALGARLEFTPRLIEDLHLVLAADASKSLTPVTLRLRDQEAWKTPFVSGALGIGLAVQFH